MPGAGERARDLKGRPVGERAAQDGDVAVLGAVGLHDHPGLDAALFGDHRRIHVRHRLTDHVAQDALQRSQAVDAHVVGRQLAAHLHVERLQAADGEAAEHLSELLHEIDAGPHEGVDGPAGDVDCIRNQVAFEGELDRLRDRDACLLRASLVDAPRCGVTTTLLSPVSDASAGGSVVNTSRPAPAISPAVRAAARASSSISPPRATLTTYALGFIAFSSASPIIPVVSGSSACGS